LHRARTLQEKKWPRKCRNQFPGYAPA
jgi:hypothetical protein